MTHCNPAPPNPDGVSMALCWNDPVALGLLGVGGAAFLTAVLLDRNNSLDGDDK